MHFVIADNMSSMDLETKAVNAIQKITKKLFTCGSCTGHHTPGRDKCQAEHSICHVYISEDWILEGKVWEV